MGNVPIMCIFHTVLKGSTSCLEERSIVHAVHRMPRNARLSVFRQFVGLLLAIFTSDILAPAGLAIIQFTEAQCHPLEGLLLQLMLERVSFHFFLYTILRCPAYATLYIHGL